MGTLTAIVDHTAGNHTPHYPSGDSAGWTWWGVMVGISVLNFALLAWTARRWWWGAGVEGRGMRVAATIFVTVCAYRAVLPRIDVARVCWFDSPLNWVLFGRICATIAEVSWAWQMGRLTMELGKRLRKCGVVSTGTAGHAWNAGASVVIMACVAECCSWTNLITENNLFAVFEQTLWMGLFLVAGAAVAALLWSWHHDAGKGAGDGPRLFFYIVFVVLVTGMGIEQGFEAFGMYLARYIHDEQQVGGPSYRSFADGLSRLAECRTVSQSLGVWLQDALWMTGYFSVAVWSSLWLSVAPLPKEPLPLLVSRPL